MTENLTIELFEYSTAISASQKYAMQKIYIEHQSSESSQGVDGHISKAALPSTIKWIGGVIANFEGITYIKITDATGLVLVDAALCSFYRAPRLEDGMLIFQVLKEY